jgi:hypothetical protein
MHNQTNMPMQTRSMINRSKPALAVSAEVSDESPFIPSHPHASSPIANSAGDTASSAICSGCSEPFGAESYTCSGCAKRFCYSSDDCFVCNSSFTSVEYIACEKCGGSFCDDCGVCPSDSDEMRWRCHNCDDEASDSQATIVDEEEEKEFDPNHFCPSWVKCCEDNLALQPKHTDPRWPEKLPTYRARFSDSVREVSLAWRAYISEICHAISYEGADGDALNNYEYESAHAFMHGNL